MALRAMTSESSDSASHDTSREETSSDAIGRSESSTDRPLPDYHPSRVKFLHEKLSKVLPRQKVDEILRIDCTASAKEAAQVLTHPPSSLASLTLPNFIIRSCQSTKYSAFL